MAENSIQDRIKALPSNSCRICEHYQRVNFDGIRNVMNRQGFCILGQLEGDYGLYVSNSISKECMGFILSELNLAIQEAEHKLDREESDYIYSLDDKRTANYKEIKPLLNTFQDFVEISEMKSKGLASLLAHQHIRKIACEHFREINRERFIELYDMVFIKKSDYTKFLAKISINIHNEFCKCDKLEFKDNKYEAPLVVA